MSVERATISDETRTFARLCVAFNRFYVRSSIGPIGNHSLKHSRLWRVIARKFFDEEIGPADPIVTRFKCSVKEKKDIKEAMRKLREIFAFYVKNESNIQQDIALMYLDAVRGVLHVTP